LVLVGKTHEVVIENSLWHPCSAYPNPTKMLAAAVRLLLLVIHTLKLRLGKSP
jgi:hypothetical protein